VETVISKTLIIRSKINLGIKDVFEGVEVSVDPL